MNTELQRTGQYLLTVKNMDSTTIMSGFALCIALGGAVLGVVNHRRIRSNCCGRNVVVSLDVESTTPPPN